MQVKLSWVDENEQCVHWQFPAFIGIVDYVIPMNETATFCVMSDHEWIDVFLDIGWKMPFPNRHFKYVRQSILAAPPSLQRVVILVQNPFSRIVVQQGLIRPYPDLQQRRVQVVGSPEHAQKILSQHPNI